MFYVEKMAIGVSGHDPHLWGIPALQRTTLLTRSSIFIRLGNHRGPR